MKPLACLGLVLLLAACAADSRYRIATFLFDGVPPRGEEPKQPQPEQPPEPQEPQAETLPSPPPDQGMRRSSVHPPYEQRSCSSCHDARASNRLVREGNELCFACHDRIITGKAVVHVVAAADCLICHLPHRADNPRLLRLAPPELCLMCHEQGLVMEVHGEIGECLACHNPHESDMDRLLAF